MRARKGIIVAATVTALWSLALPAHAGDDGVIDDDPEVTASQCTDGGGTVDMSSVCRGGTADGFLVIE